MNEMMSQSSQLHFSNMVGRNAFSKIFDDLRRFFRQPLPMFSLTGLTRVCQ
jgi:hypothetical protein